MNHRLITANPPRTLFRRSHEFQDPDDPEPYSPRVLARRENMSNEFQDDPEPYSRRVLARRENMSNEFQDDPEPYSRRVLARRENMSRENMSNEFQDDPGTTWRQRTSWIDSNPSQLRVVAAPGRRRVVYRDDYGTNSWRERIHGCNVPDRRWIFRDPEGGFRVIDDRERETRRWHGTRDNQTTAPLRKTSRRFPVRKPLQISNLPRRRWTTRDPSHFQAFSSRKRRRLTPLVAPGESSLRVSNSPKRRWTSRNSSNFQAFPFRKRKRLAPRESTLQVSDFQKRRSKRLATRVAIRESTLQVPDFRKRRSERHIRESTSQVSDFQRLSKRLAPQVAIRESTLQVPDLQKKRSKRHIRESTSQVSDFQRLSKRLAPRVDIRESTLQVPAFQKRRTHKFRKWFPLRISNQLMKRSQRSYACFKCKKLGHFARRCPQNKCFKCKKLGHYAIRCPQNMANNKSSLSSSVSVFVEKDGLEYAPPSLLCQCGLRCSLGTRKKNNRKVYTCPLKSCKTFRWEDEVKEDELISVPRCECGAGFCRQYTESDGTEVGRKYFACPIKKGQGACRFLKLLNDESLTNNRPVERINPLKFKVGNCSGTFPWKDLQKEIRSNVLDTVEYYPNEKEISGNQEGELMEVDLGCKEDTSNKTPRKCNKRLRDGAPKNDSSFSNTVVELVTPQSYSEGGDTEGIAHVRKSMYLRQTSIEQNVFRNL
ncbi:hypothetical protein AgCh_014343 [Apium graveolens]